MGLYVAPPTHAVVLSMDEKSQIQALDRTQPGLPLKKGRGPTMTHDYKRNGTTTLFAALNVLDGSVIGRNMQRHRHQEFIRFLNQIERDVPAGKVIHVILDNYCTHKHAKVQAWLERHPRWTFHFIPTSSSWLNAVEGFFAKLTRRRLKHGVFHSVVDLQAAINRFIAEHNDTEAKPFIWRADPDEIIAARNRGFQMLDSIHYIELVGQKRRDHAVPLLADKFQIGADKTSDTLGDIDVIACKFAIGVLEIERRIGAFHADAQRLGASGGGDRQHAERGDQGHTKFSHWRTSQSFVWYSGRAP